MKPTLLLLALLLLTGCAHRPRSMYPIHYAFITGFVQGYAYSQQHPSDDRVFSVAESMLVVASKRRIMP